MPITDPAARKVILAEASLSIYASSTYNFSKRDPDGTAKNCEAASRALIAKAEEKGVEGLRLVYASPADGFFVPSPGGSVQAFGLGKSPVGGSCEGYVFANHYRVRDTVTQSVYDPTFGTSSPFNPIGLAGTGTDDDRDPYGTINDGSMCVAVTSTVTLVGKGFQMTSSGQVVSSGAIEKGDSIDDTAYS